MRYELYYWPEIQGRGEYVRLALEAAEADYVDVARESGRGMGVSAMMRMMDSTKDECVPFAPPFLKAGDVVVGQVANILLFLGARLGLAPDDEAGRLWVHQLQLTVADFVTEIHDTHHPIGSGLYYEDQKAEAAERAADFLEHRLPKYLGYFDRVLAQNPHKGGYLAGSALSYADLSIFQLIEGLRYAFPKAMKRAERKVEDSSACTIASRSIRRSCVISSPSAASRSTTWGSSGTIRSSTSSVDARAGRRLGTLSPHGQAIRFTPEQGQRTPHRAPPFTVGPCLAPFVERDREVGACAMLAQLRRTPATQRDCPCCISAASTASTERVSHGPISISSYRTSRLLRTRRYAHQIATNSGIHT